MAKSSLLEKSARALCFDHLAAAVAADGCFFRGDLFDDVDRGDTAATLAVVAVVSFAAVKCADVARFSSFRSVSKKKRNSVKTNSFASDFVFIFNFHQNAHKKYICQIYNSHKFYET